MVPYRRVRLKISTAVAADWRPLEFVFSIGYARWEFKIEEIVLFLVYWSVVFGESTSLISVPRFFRTAGNSFSQGIMGRLGQ